MNYLGQALEVSGKLTLKANAKQTLGWGIKPKKRIKR
jgi:hypothetical protein